MPFTQMHVCMKSHMYTCKHTHAHTHTTGTVTNKQQYLHVGHIKPLHTSKETNTRHFSRVPAAFGGVGWLQLLLLWHGQLSHREANRKIQYLTAAQQHTAYAEVPKWISLPSASCQGCKLVDCLQLKYHHTAAINSPRASFASTWRPIWMSPTQTKQE